MAKGCNIEDDQWIGSLIRTFISSLRPLYTIAFVVEVCKWHELSILFQKKFTFSTCPYLSIHDPSDCPMFNIRLYGYLLSFTEPFTFVLALSTFHISIPYSSIASPIADCVPRMMRIFLFFLFGIISNANE